MPDIFNSNPSDPVNPTPAVPIPHLKSSFASGSSMAHQALSSYMFMPEGVSFQTQEPGETIILLLRMHFITNLAWLFIASILLILPLFLFPGVAFFNLIPSDINRIYITFIILIWYLVTFTYILVNFLHWYFNIWIVTQTRIIDIEFVNLLYKKFSETRIARIEDVTERTGGFLRSILDFGDVVIQTAAEQNVFEFKAVPHPEEVVKIVNQLMGNFEENQ